jgi:hypothetical protein
MNALWSHRGPPKKDVLDRLQAIDMHYAYLEGRWRPEGLRRGKWQAVGPATCFRQKVYFDAAAYGVSSLRMILPPFITNLTR